jgi:hypothetical protein
MPRYGMQDVASCKLFNHRFFLGSYEVSARKDDKQAKLPHVQNNNGAVAQLLQNLVGVEKVP